MKTCLLIVIIHSICASIIIPAVLEGNQTQQIQNLEKEKVEIYNQLNDAFKDTIKTLEKNNDSDAREGIVYIKELFALIGKFNGTEFELAQGHAVCNGSKECASNLTTISKTANSSNFLEDGRRKSLIKKSGFDHIKQAIIGSGMFQSRDNITLIKDEKMKTLLVLQTKLDKWLQLREIEKQKIKQYRLKQASLRRDTITEECPNFGEMKKKSKGGNRKYPCCRKCCKKSYLGCL